MERIDLEPETIFKAKDSRKFANEEECARYEYLLDKYSARHRTLADGDGIINHFYKVYSDAEAEECSELARYTVGYRCSLNPDITYKDSVIWIPNDNIDGYGPCPEMKLITDFINEQKDAINAFLTAIEDAMDIDHELSITTFSE